MDDKSIGKFGFYAIISSIGFLPLFLVGATLFVVILFTADFESLGFGGSLKYDTDCNYELTKVTVMNGRNTEVLATVNLEDYILGVLCGESGVCDGQVASMDEDYVKAQIVAYKTYSLARRGQYNSKTKSITMKASTRDQQWCSIEKGCIYTTETTVGEYYNGNPVYYLNTYPGDYDESKFQNETKNKLKRSFTDEDLELLRKYYADTYGELFLSDSYNSVINTLGSSDSTSYASLIQDFWKKEAANGKNYEQILLSTPSSGVRYSDQYAGKSIYKLGRYCASRSTHSSSIDYVAWMIDIANDDTHGYCQYDGINIGGVLSKGRVFNPDIDCSSFVYYALLNNGYTEQELGGSWPFTTVDMGGRLKNVGFKELKFDVDSLEPGDILWRSGHTEVYIGDGKNVGAHIAETGGVNGKPGDQTGHEVDVGATGSNWTKIYRKS